MTCDAVAHEARRFKDVGIGFDELDAGLPRGLGSEFDKLFIALNFWDGWIDARNHDWQYYKGIREADWPQLARQIVAALSEDRDISEPVVPLHILICASANLLKEFSSVWSIGFRPRRVLFQ